MKKRRIASTRHMSKDDKRRLLLGKNQESRSTNKKVRNISFPRPSSSNGTVLKTDGGVAVRTPISKRMLALILAIIFILGVVPSAVFLTLKGRASAEATVRLDPVTMQVRINGSYTGETTINPGKIADNIGDVVIDNPTNAEFVKAVIVDSNGTETQVYSVGDKNHVVYYSISQNGYTGVAKDDSDTLVLVYANKYTVTFANASGDANSAFTTDGNELTFNSNVHYDSDDGSYYIYGGENIEFKAVTPAQDYSASKFTYKSTTTSGSETVKNSAAKISYKNITGNTTITAQYNAISEYTVKDSRDMSNSNYYPSLSGVDNHGGTTTSLSSDTGSLNSATSDSSWTSTFYVFSQANSGSEVWRLDMLSINGVDILYPTTEGANTTATVNGMGVTVTFTDSDGTFTGESRKPRTFYQIDLTNVHQNVEVAYYFTNTKEYTIIVRGLEGIAATGAAYEDEYMLNRYYTFDTNEYNAYTANYTAPGILTGTNWYPSDNLILYRVKPGYNPYTVSTEMSYDNGATKTSSGIRETSASGGDTAVGTPLEVIKNAGNSSTGRYNTSFRHWGQNYNELENTDNDYKKGFRTYDLLLTTVNADQKSNGTTWYAVALAQNSTKVQQLYLNATPYKYRLELDLDGGNLSDTNYAQSGDYYLESSVNGHTVASDTKAYLPSTDPTQSGKAFVGWQMYDSSDDSLITSTTYSKSDLITIDEDTIQYAYGDVTGKNLTIRFKAIWVDLKDADATTVNVNSYYQTAISNDDATKYTQVLSDAEETQVKGATYLINDETGKTYDDHYIVNTTKSRLSGTTESLNNDGTYGSDNEFYVYYDYRLHTMSVSKSVMGYPKSKQYTITVVLTRDATSPVDFTTAQSLIVATVDGTSTTITPTADATDETLTYVLILTKDQKVDFTDVPYGWTYEVTEPENSGDYTNDISNSSGTVTKDIDVVVTNMVDTAELSTNKYIEFNPTTGKYDLTLESWATGEKITKYDKDPVDTDIVLVIDQSGSMATGDMGDQYTGITKNWKISDAAGDKVYYYYDSVDKKYYPVHAGTGTVYVENEAIRIYDLMGGTGYGSIVTGAVNYAYYGIPTDYYVFPDNSNEVKKLYVASCGVLLKYKAFPYYYLDSSDEPSSSWSDNIHWAGTFHAENLRGWHMNVGFVSYNESKVWTALVDNNKVMGHYDSGDISAKSSSWEGYSYTWFSDGEMVSGVYKQSTGLNHLYYTKDDGTVVNLTANQGKTVYRTDNDTAYSGVLYEITGKPRYEALQDAVKNFSELVAQNAADNNVENRMAIVGFAGNETPASSSGTTPNYSGLNSKWDYVNTGLFVNGNFISYKEITSYRKLGSSETAYVNRHYYILDSGTYVPVVCDTNNRWYRLDTYYYVSGTDGTKYYDFYEPVYKPLDDNNGNQYENALLNVTANDGNDNNTYNDYIDTTIDKFSAYGGTYTSYGMAMANQIFANNYDEDRNHIIVVFTDGQPGGYGFEEDIANEAIAESAIAKNQYGASVYTIGLYTENQTQQVTDFMNQLSSNSANATTSNVYGGTQNMVSADGTSNLDADGTYYYTDTDGKTYSVKATDSDGTSTLGWWSTVPTTSNGETFNVYTSYVPHTNSDDSRSDHTAFYTEQSGGSEIYSTSRGFSTSNTYWVGSSGSRVAVNYEYRWYNSNGRIKDPATSDSDSALNHVQFFTVTSDSYSDNGYYETASNTTALANAFKDIAENMSKTTVTLTASNSVLRDIVTANFENVDSDNISVYTVDGTYDTTTDEITWTQENGSDKLVALAGATKSVSTSDSLTTVDIQGFDYSTTYLSAGHTSGQKLVVKITDIDPTETGFSLASNTGDSGIYQTESGKDDTLLAPFTIPLVNRPEYTLKVTGDDNTATYKVLFKLTKDDGSGGETQLTADQYIALLGDTTTWPQLQLDSDNNYIVWSSAGNGTDSTIDLEDVFKDLPEGYHVYAKQVNTGRDTDTFTYTTTLNGSTVANPESFFEITPNGSTIEITSKRVPVDVVIRELTEASDGSNDYADKGKVFDIEVTLVDENGDEVDSDVTYGSTSYTEGKITLNLRHEQTRTIQVPNGYSIKVRELDSYEYDDTYTKTYDENGSETDISKSAEVAVDSTYTRVTVINTLDTMPQTGLLDSLSKISPFVWIAILICLFSAGGFAVYDRRKRKENE